MSSNATWPPPMPSTTTGPAPAESLNGPIRPTYAWVSFAFGLLVAVPTALYALLRLVVGAVGCSMRPEDCARYDWTWFVIWSVATIAVPIVAMAMTRSTRSFGVNVSLCVAMFVPAVTFWQAYLIA